MRLTGPYYKISGDHGALYLPADLIGKLRDVVGHLAECARIDPQPGSMAITYGTAPVSGALFPSGADRWHVVLRATNDGLTCPLWLSVHELTVLRDALNDHPLPGEIVP